MSTAVEFCKRQGKEIATDPNTRIEDDLYLLLAKEFNKDMALKIEAERQAQERQGREILKSVTIDEPKKPEHIPTEIPKPKMVGKIDLDADKKRKAEEEAARKAAEEAQKAEEARIAAEKAAAEAAAKAKAEAEKKAAQEAQAAKEAAERAIAEAAKKAEQAAQAAEEPVEQSKEEIFRLGKPVLKNAPKVLGKIDLSTINTATHPTKKTKEEKRKEREAREQQRKANKPAANNGGGKAADAPKDGEKRKRERIKQNKVDINDARNQKPQKKNGKAKGFKVEVDDEAVQRQIKETIQRLQGNKGKSTTSKHKRERRELEREKMAQERAAEQEQSKVLKLTEFVTANDLAVMMNVPVTKVIGTCMMLGVMVSINQRLDAETINLVAEEFGFSTEFVSAEVVEEINADEVINDEDITSRCPIVTVMAMWTTVKHRSSTISVMRM